jgi:hypothetical protein
MADVSPAVIWNFLNARYTVVCPNFRLLPEARWAEMMSDITNLGPWLRRLPYYLSADFDPKRTYKLIVFGNSVGAHLAILTVWNDLVVQIHQLICRPRHTSGRSNPQVFPRSVGLQILTMFHILRKTDTSLFHVWTQQMLRLFARQPTSSIPHLQVSPLPRRAKERHEQLWQGECS